MDLVLGQCAKALQETGSLNSASSRTLKGILTKPLDAYSIIELLDLSSYPDVMRLLDNAMQKQVAVERPAPRRHAGYVKGREPSRVGNCRICRAIAQPLSRCQ